MGVFGLQFIMYKTMVQDWRLLYITRCSTYIACICLMNAHNRKRHFPYMEHDLHTFQIRKLRDQNYNVLFLHWRSLSFQTGMRPRNRLKGTGRLFASC